MLKKTGKKFITPERIDIIEFCFLVVTQNNVLINFGQFKKNAENPIWPPSGAITPKVYTCDLANIRFFSLQMILFQIGWVKIPSWGGEQTHRWLMVYY